MAIGTAERWPALLPGAESILEHYRTREKSTLRLGGGTSLAFFLDHRLSFDLDLFAGDPAPRAGHLQRLMASGLPHRLTDDVRYPGDYVKLLWKDVGEIDLLSASPLSPHRGIAVVVDDVELCLEHPEEVLAKKLVHHASTGVKGRDVYDVHACMEAGIVLPSNLTSIVGQEMFDVVLEALEYDMDRIMGEIAELAWRRLDPTADDLYSSIGDLAATAPTSEFVEYEPVPDFGHLASRLGLRIETSSASEHGL